MVVSGAMVGRPGDHGHCGRDNYRRNGLFFGDLCQLANCTRAPNSQKREAAQRKSMHDPQQSEHDSPAPKQRGEGSSRKR